MNSILKNTLALYARQIIVLLVSLYTVRVLLNTLGEDDYGIYCVISGVVSLFTFLGTSMALASQRFLAFEIGRGDLEALKRVFSVSLTLYLLIAVLAFLLLETVGLWFVRSKLAISPERFQAAVWLYQFSIISFLCTLLTTPYLSATIAHEDMGIFSTLSIVDAFLKLGAVFLLQSLETDKLPVYGLFLCFAASICLVGYVSTCHVRYKECGFFFYWDKTLFKEITSFTGWSLFGELTAVFPNQAVTILLNQMFSPAVVAARAIGAQLSGVIRTFSTHFNTGLSPFLIKRYAAGQRDETIQYMFLGARIAFFLMFLFSLPLFLGMQTLLLLWLKNPPEYTLWFAQLALVDGAIHSVSLPLMTVARATGKIRLYELVLGSILGVGFFISVLVLYLGFPPYGVMYVAISVTTLMFFVRLWIVKRLIRFSLLSFFKKVMVPIISVAVLSGTVSAAIFWAFPEKTFLGVCVKLTASVVFTLLCIYGLGITSDERKTMLTMLADQFSAKTKQTPT